MTTKQILIGAAIIGGAFLIYSRSKSKGTSETTPPSDVTKSNQDSKGMELSKPSLDMDKPLTKAQAKPKRGQRPNERGRAISSSLSSAKAKAAAQSQVGVEIAEFAFNGHSF